MAWPQVLSHAQSIKFLLLAIASFPLTKVQSLATRSRSATSDFQKLPFVGIASLPQVTFTVIGTSHFQCKSASEITTLIRELKPDGVVVELDPERAIRLTNTALYSDSHPWFGADFLAAIDTARDINVPLFIGDEYMEETKARFMDTLFSPASYSPRPLLSIFRSDSQINLFQTFVQDPMKSTPLIASLLAPLATILLGSSAQGHGLTLQVTSIQTALEVLLSLIVSFLTSCKVYNTLIADRDVVLAGRAQIAAQVVSSLRRKETIRKRWTFSAEPKPMGTKKAKKPPNDTLPLFTLKRQLEEATGRTLVLFEPRWLAMIDSLVLPKSLGQKQDSGGVGMVEHSNSESSTASVASFGCLTCVNKFYCTVSLDDNGTKIQGRYADVIFKRHGRMASIRSLVEGKRQQSGDRKVTVEIEGGDDFFLRNDKDILVSEDGYLMSWSSSLGSSLEAEEEESFVTMAGHDTASCSDNDISIIVVVGLLHANGVVDQLGRQ